MVVDGAAKISRDLSFSCTGLGADGADIVEHLDHDGVGETNIEADWPETNPAQP